MSARSPIRNTWSPITICPPGEGARIFQQRRSNFLPIESRLSSRKGWVRVRERRGGGEHKCLKS
jgi:hypothetical protein